MPWYNDLRPDSDQNKQSFGQTFPKLDDPTRIKIIENLLRLRDDLKDEIPDKKSDQTILVATWNLREFGHYENRLIESYFYIAEILNRFDLIAIQEIKGSMDDLLIVMRLLGSDWGYLINDITGGQQGNRESFAYIYNKNRVEPTGLAGEIVLWDEISQDLSISQLMRTPYITGFKAGWKSFAIINVHLKPSNAAQNQEIRKDEIKALVSLVSDRIKDKTMWTDNLMLMGDFNLYNNNQDMIDIITDKGFYQLPHLIDKATNVSGTQAYDKIFYLKHKYFDLAHPQGNPSGDVYDIFRSVFRRDDWVNYTEEMLEHKEDESTLVDDDAFERYYRVHWKTRQLSDHLPVWISMKIDSSDQFLEEKLEILEEE